MTELLSYGPVRTARMAVRKPTRELIVYSGDSLICNNYGTELSPLDVVTHFFPNGVEPMDIHGFSNYEVKKFRTTTNLGYHHRLVALKTACDAVREGLSSCDYLELGVIGDQEFLIFYHRSEKRPSFALEVVQGGEAAICSV
jgi:hypothetical protein